MEQHTTSLRSQTPPTRKTGAQSPNPLARVTAALAAEQTPPDDEWQTMVRLATRIAATPSMASQMAAYVPLGKEEVLEWLNAANELAQLSLRCAEDHRQFVEQTMQFESSVSTLSDSMSSSIQEALGSDYIDIPQRPASAGYVAHMHQFQSQDAHFSGYS